MYVSVHVMCLLFVYLLVSTASLSFTCACIALGAVSLIHLVSGNSEMIHFAYFGLIYLLVLRGSFQVKVKSQVSQCQTPV